MARILYGVAGQGFGHGIRAKIIADYLLNKGHEVYFVSHNQGEEYLSTYFPVQKIHGMRLRYTNNILNVPLTSFEYVVSQPAYYKSVQKIRKIIREKSIDIVISDFEPLVTRAAEKEGRMVLSIDNQHALTRTDVPLDHFNWVSVMLLKSTMHLFAEIKAGEYFVTSFFPTISKDQHTHVFPPLIRPEVLAEQYSTTDNGHIVVYSTSRDTGLIKKLAEVHGDYRFIVYGFGREEQYNDKIQLKKFDETNFLKDLTSCRAIIGTSGSNLVAEALYLKKPFLAVPVKMQLEQTINGYYIEKLGYGLMRGPIDTLTVETFLSHISDYVTNLQSYEQKGNSDILDAIESFVARHSTTTI